MFRKVLLYFSVAIIFTSSCDAKTITNTNADTEPNDDSSGAARQQTNVTVESILSLLEKREKQIDYRPGEDIILIIGRTGTGKSTVTQFLAENDRQQALLDEGEIVISDRAGIISPGSTTHSHTSIPTWVPNNRTNTSFYDCPAFEDPRGVRSDISNSYLIQSLLKQSGRVKFMLVEDHHNLKMHADRDPFLNLLRDVAALIPDVEKFQASIALCTNKVTSPTLSDEQVISYVAKFLNSTRGDFAEGSSEWRLINILLNQSSNKKAGAKYTRLGLLRTPSETGFTKNMPSLSQSKRILDDIVYKYLAFTKVEDSDFGYAISDNSKLHIHELADKVATRITSNIANSIVVHFQQLETSLTEDSISELAAQYRLSCSYLVGVKRQLEKSQNLDELVERTIPEMSIELNVTFEPRVLSNITEYKNDLQFLQKISNNVAVAALSKDFLAGELDFVCNSERWYTFYSKCYDELGSYNVQKNYHNYNISKFTATLKRLLADSALDEFSIQQIGLKEFVTQFPTLELDFNLEPSMMVNRFKLENMQNMAKAFFEYKVQMLSLATNLLIRGRFVTFSAVLHHLTNETFKTIQIFASNTVFIDASLNRTGTLDQLSIIAPKWSIVTCTSISIILDGANGHPVSTGRARDGQSAEKPDGENGKPGNAGGAAGNFLGLGVAFVSIDKLSVFASGGNGSAGQDGGNGLDGKDGVSPINTRYGNQGRAQRFSGPMKNDNLTSTPTPKIGGKATPKGPKMSGPAMNDIGKLYSEHAPDDNDLEGEGLCGDNADFGGDFKSKPADLSQCDKLRCPTKYDRPMGSLSCCGKIVYAKSNSTDGGNAGHGGAAGRAGLRGTVKVVMLPTGEFLKHLKIHDQNGATASNGKPGSPGNAAKTNAYDYNPILYKLTLYKNSSNLYRSYEVSEVCDRKSYTHISVPGKAGNYGGGSSSLPTNETQSLIDPEKIVNHYKEFIRAELVQISGSLQEKSPEKFLEYIETSPNVTDWYVENLFGLAADLQILERQYLEYANKVSPTTVLSSYRFLQDRVRAVSSSLSSSQNHDPKLKLSYVNAAAMTKITALNYQTSNSLIIDITSYLDLLLERVNEYKDFKVYIQKANIHDNVQQQIKKSIEEAHQMVIDSVNTEIDKIFDQLNKYTAKLIVDVETAETEAQKQVKQLKTYREKLETSILFINILNAVQICSQFLKFLGPVGAGVGAVIAGGAEIGKTVASVDDLQRLSALPSPTTMASMTDRLRRECQVFKDQLSEGITMLESTRISGNEVAELKNKFQAAKKTIEKEEQKNQMNFVSPQTVQLVKQGLRQFLETQGNTTNQNVKTLCSQLIITVGVTADCADLYKKNKAHKGRLAELDRAIQAAEKSSYQLNQFKQATYTNMIPMFQSIHDNVNNLGQRLEHNSHTSLLVSKWNVQKTLDNVIRMLSHMSSVFPITEDMTVCVKQVLQGASLIIDIYDTIQNYEDRSQMVRYIHDMSSDLGQITNATERSVLDNITTQVETNIILGEYFNAMSNIKPYVFPFPTYFLHNVYSLPIPASSGPSQFGSSELEKMLKTVSQNITQINNRIKKDQLEVKGEYDQYIRQTEFKHSKSGSPFYRWTGHPGLVQRLLRGETITVAAKVQDQIKNAVKFKEIGIYLRIQSAGNMTVEEVEAQKELDLKLHTYMVYMTHMGVSYYRCDDTFYMMHTNDDLTFSFSFEKNEKGEPRDKNNVYTKVSQGVYVLSPYTTWQIRLKPATNSATKTAAPLNTGVSSRSALAAILNKGVAFEGDGALLRLVQGPNPPAFSEFEPFLNRSIILELEGKGQYVDPEGGPEICARERVSDYYVKVRSLI